MSLQKRSVSTILGAAAALLLACAGAGGVMPQVARAASTPATVAQAGPPDAETLPPSELDPQQLASTLMQTISQFDQVRAQLAENQKQLGTVQAQVRTDQAGLQKLNRQIKRLTTKAASLTKQDRQARVQLAVLTRAIYVDPSTASPSVLVGTTVKRLIYVDPSTALLPALARVTLESRLTPHAKFDVALSQAQATVARLDSMQRRTQASRARFEHKRARLTADMRAKQTSQSQLQTQSAQLESQEESVASRWSQSMTAVSAVRTNATLTSAQTSEMSTLGTGGLDQQTLDAGLAAGMYNLSSASQIQWPAEPDALPLGLADYQPYCQYSPIQCTCYAANAYQKYTGGTLPEYLGNGGQWINSAQADGIPTSQTPSEGSVVSFSGPEYSVDGHVALVRSLVYAGSTVVGLVVWERNFDEAGGFDVRLVSLGAGSEIAGYIPPGV